MITSRLMVRSRLVIACVLAAGLYACAQHAKNPQDMANAVAQALYNNDFNAVTQNFDDALKAQATRTQVALISDKMHALGDFQGLTETKRDEDTRRYWYDAKFSKGDMTVEMRTHADGTVAAYRIVPSS
jgi:hypothetical protein